ncbi:MAG TPA: MFS transporter, partial [Sediminispirochaeta sp.]|nr:MFS transporter [Sediminispirochaeta sp.]
MENNTTKLNRRIGYLLVVGMGAKFFIDTSNQLFNPYLLVYAGGLGVSGLTMGHLVSLRNLSGLSAPLIGSLADRIGYRRVMQLCLLALAGGVLLLASGLGPVVFIPAMLLWGLGQGGFTPTVHSYLSSRLPYRRRSRYLGMLEYSWALAGIFGLFLIGLLIEVYGWRAPLYLLGAGALISALAVSTLPLSPDATRKVPPRAVAKRPALRGFFDLGKHRASAWGAAAVNVFNFFAL